MAEINIVIKAANKAGAIFAKVKEDAIKMATGISGRPIQINTNSIKKSMAEVGKEADKASKKLKDMESERDVHIHKLRASLEVFRKEMKRLAGMKGTLTHRSWQDMADQMLAGKVKEANRRSQLQKLRNLFMRDGNMESLQQGVVTCMQRFA
jgi:hypothetical protein